jgi:hypothetical protein
MGHDAASCVGGRSRAVSSAPKPHLLLGGQPWATATRIASCVENPAARNPLAVTA